MANIASKIIYPRQGQACPALKADYDRFRQVAPERRCELFLEILKKKGVEGYKALCAALDTSQPFIKSHLISEGDEDLVYVNVDIMEDRYKKELAEKDGEIADLRSSVQRLQEQIQQKSLGQANLTEMIKKEREEHRSQTEKQNEAAEALKMQLSKLNKDLQHSQAKYEDIVKMHEGRWQRLQQIVHHILGFKGSDSRMARLQDPELVTSQDVYDIVTNLLVGTLIPGETIPHGITLEGYATVHIIKDDRTLIVCPKLQLDAGRVNTDRCHVTTDGELANSRPAELNTDSGILQGLFGTCGSTPIPLPPPPSSVTPVSHTTRYWETHTRVDVVDEVWWWPFLEMGVGEESQVDSECYPSYQRRSWCVRVGKCPTHPESLCTRVNLAGERGKCYSNTMSDTPGTQTTFHYGVVLDVGRGRIGFIDVDRSVVLGKVDVEFREDLLPVFAVDPYSELTVNMKVVSGEEILMSDIKKSLIIEVLA